MLKSENIRILGGEVESLVEENTPERILSSSLCVTLSNKFSICFALIKQHYRMGQFSMRKSSIQMAFDLFDTNMAKLSLREIVSESINGFIQCYTTVIMRHWNLTVTSLPVNQSEEVHLKPGLAFSGIYVISCGAIGMKFQTVRPTLETFIHQLQCN